MSAAVPDLLLILDQTIRSDRAPAGFEGTLCVAVGRGEDLRFWTVALGARSESWFSRAMPLDADAMWGLGEDEAKAVMGAGPMPAHPLWVTQGDTSLLAKFARRYLSGHSGLSVRMQGAL